MSAPFDDILVYLDGSEGSMVASMYAIMLAKQTGARLHGLYVMNTKALGDLEKAHVFISSERAEYREELEKDARRHTRHLEKTAATKGVSVTCEILEGSPSAEVGRFIRANRIDVLVIGQLNMIRSRREELTNENERMLRSVPCPVLVAKDNNAIWEMFEEN
ncbi:MAG: universal stress protein [Sphaerochaetaceae bacterium]|nr:universal stress protein [Sphaerochaetaceae bacterium]